VTLDWNHRPVLVTGATGLVGSWLVGALLDLGAQPVCLVRDTVPAARFFTSGLSSRSVVCRGDVQDQAAVERVLGEYEVRTVFHLAAQTIVPIANRNPISTFETNIKGTWTVLEACRRSPMVSQVVVASSDKAYGQQDHLPYTEETPLQGRAPYDVSKSCTDLISRSYAETWSLPLAITRCGNFFGGGDLNFNRLVPGVIRDLIEDRRPVIRSDGTSIRDYLYVEDGASAYIATAETIDGSAERVGRAYNFSIGLPLSVLEMVDRITQAVGVSLPPLVQGTATNEIPAQYLDATRARTELGWAPVVGLDAGLERTVDWYRTLLGARA